MSSSAIQPITDTSLERAAQIIKNGGLIVVPTDTVYGIACDPFDSKAIDKLFEVKHRPRSKSIQVLLPDLDVLQYLGLKLVDPLDKLSDAFLPGALSPIALAEPSSRLASIRRDVAADGSVHLSQAIRVPDSASLRRILSVVGPLAATSANLSGQESSTSAQQAYEVLGDDVELYLDAGHTPGPISSTVVAANSEDAQGIAILRQGVISEEVLRHFLLSGRLAQHRSKPDDILGSADSAVLKTENNSSTSTTAKKEVCA